MQSEIDTLMPKTNWSKAALAYALLDMRIVETPLFNEAAEAYAKKRKVARKTPIWWKLRAPAESAEQPVSRYDSWCHLYCPSCNYDEHQCGGCGTPTAHGINSCYECCKDMGIEFLPLRMSETPPHLEYRGSSLTKFNAEYKQWRNATLYSGECDEFIAQGFIDGLEQL